MNGTARMGTPVITVGNAIIALPWYGDEVTPRPIMDHMVRVMVAREQERAQWEASVRRGRAA